MTESGYLVSRSGVAVYVRATGLANMANTPVLEAFLNEELTLGVQVVCVDLSECIGMDSTFMGTLVAFHHRLQIQDGRFMVVNPSSGNRRLLDMLGVSTVLPVLGDHSVPDLAFIRLQNGGAMSPIERAHLMKRAHEALMDLSDANRDKFTPFLAALEADLQRRQRDTES